MPSSSEQSFRSNLSQFRWARGVTDDSQQSQQPLQSSNPFSRFYNAIAGDYIPLRSSERSNEDEAWFALSRWERLLGFGACLLGAAVCFFVAFMTLPFLAINPAKFALAFSLGSLLVMFGFSVLIGPLNHAKHLISKERLPFTLVYFASLGLTLYFSISVSLQSFIITASSVTTTPLRSTRTWVRY
ncbi:Got1/Sft2-like family-domain-containing protein [Suillus placidus]|uniref:Protein transport protein SFT2 n=1 Tax=Suillus placidus TaxID=48579 RepID=A0A9P7CZK3_9AGAM|nr:Got1/Sft2-like family-domain-containing protein [Suillus placidus]